jgi:hypothetical protein
MNKGKKEGWGLLDPSLALKRVLCLPLLSYNYCFTTFCGAENSEVLPPGPVAVAVSLCPALTFALRVLVKETSPVASVLTLLVPRYVLPS